MLRLKVERKKKLSLFKYLSQHSFSEHPCYSTLPLILIPHKKIDKYTSYITNRNRTQRAAHFASRAVTLKRDHPCNPLVYPAFTVCFSFCVLDGWRLGCGHTADRSCPSQRGPENGWAHSSQCTPLLVSADLHCVTATTPFGLSRLPVDMRPFRRSEAI